MNSDYIIDFEGLDVLQDDNLILSDVTFQVKKGEFIYLIGRVGSGKTSLIKVINAEIPATIAQTARVAEFNLRKLRAKQVPFLRRRMGVIFQDFKLLTDRSVHDNLLFVLKATGWKDKVLIEQRIKEVLEDVDLTSKTYKMPHQLSGGEQQRIAIARALLNHPEIIVADEPTGNLDPETSEVIMKLLFNINKESGITIVIATHNHSLLKKFPGRTFRCDKNAMAEVIADAEIELDD